MNELLAFNVAQAFGLLSFLLGVFTFLQKKDHTLKIFMIALFACQSIHFILLGASSAVVANILSILRTFVSLKFQHVYLGVLFIIANITFGLFLYQSLYSVLAILGACLGTFAVFYLKGINMRIAFILGAVCWVSHNIIVGSIGGILLESMVICMNTITIVRIQKDHTK